jgi:hypothetical protein
MNDTGQRFSKPENNSSKLVLIVDDTPDGTAFLNALNNIFVSHAEGKEGDSNHETYPGCE